MLSDKNIESIENAVGYCFKDKMLLTRAFTHSSYSENSYEKLEFLGDSILNFVIADELYKRYGDLDEGDLSKARSNIVDKPPLKKFVIKNGLEKFIRLGASEKRNHIEKSDKLCGDLYEAILGAIYLDGDIAKAGKFVVYSLNDTIEEVVSDKDNLTDYKSKLLEYCSKNKLVWKFDYEKSGVDHNPIFNVKLYVDGRFISSAKGTSKKKAEQTASEIAITELMAEK